MAKSEATEDLPKTQFTASKSQLKRLQKQSHKKKNKAGGGGFQSLGLIPTVYRGVMKKGYLHPTPIQRKTMPLILAGADVVAMARTGSGKTAAFLVPMLQKLQQHIPGNGVRALILSPTRDLAIQTLKFTKELGKFTDLHTSLLVGGDSMEEQFEELSQNPDIIIATPGRLMHHLAEVEGMSLRTVEYVVFDEADCLFGMGFAEQLHQILLQLSETRQTLLFSATLPSALAEFAKAGLRDPELIRIDLETKISPDLKMTFFTLRHEEKIPALLYLVREQISSNQQTLIFVSTKHHVEFLNTLFREEGIDPSVCYGDMDQDARKIHISKFRARKTMLLIVTDIAARGIDIPLLDNVVNWDIPPKPKIFIHRVGRVARAGRTGTAYSFVTPEDMPYLLDLHLFLSKPLRAAPTEDEVLRDLEGVYSRIDQALADGETVYGRFPQTVIDLTSDRIKSVIDGGSELLALQKACTNAFRLYTKTKPTPSRESIKRAKDLPREGLHPIFRSLVGSNELTALAFSERLKAYRPKQTILEAEGEAAQSKHGPNQWLDVMRRKRAVHEGVITLVHQQRSADQTPKVVVEEETTLSHDWERKEEEQGGGRRLPVPRSNPDGIPRCDEKGIPTPHSDSAQDNVVDPRWRRRGRHGRTGSGKTAAFLVLMLQKLQQHIPGNGVRALILSPTRDLAIQTLKFTKELGKFTGSSEIVWLRCSSLSKRLEICGLKRKAKTFKDDEYYISSVPTNQHHEAGLSVKNNEGFASSRLDAAVLDLVADDGAGLQKQKSVYHWDKKSKKYIKLNNGERVTASGKIKTESGAKVKASKTGIYKKWKERSHKQISLDGSKDTKEDGTAHGGGRQIRGGNKWQLKGGRNRRSIPNANVPSELRDPEQVRKDRQQKATKIAQFKNKLSSKKGNNNKFGKDKGNSKFGKDKGNNKFGKNKGQKKSKGRF